MERVNTAVLVSGGGTNLQAIIDSAARGELPSVRLALVVSNKAGAYALERAENAGIAHAYVPNGPGFESALAELLRVNGVELIVLAGFLRILSADFIRSFEGRIINVHPSLIPSFCGKGFYGLRVHEAALARGVKVTGATVHIVTEEADAGPILMQKAVEVRDGDTPELLQRRVMEQAEWLLLPAACEQLAHKILIRNEV
ncbi:MAG: phosphoribosylglycinamide formyltransferase [Clostridia bacterium]|nr:phosphoribosylglycinamide formyltransferase [Clostridia bacterium]MBR6429199.1 phosphoribosylglycinamide formyltransferase [Clostridia bacterium]